MRWSWPRSRSSAALVAALACAGLITLEAGPAALKGQAGQPAPAQTPQFRAAVDLVEVDVTVIGRDGKPVTNLSPADFEIRERGVRQRIETIYLVTADPSIAGHGSPVTAAAALPPIVPGVPVRVLQPRVFIFVFDLTHLSAAGFSRTRTAVRSFLEDGLRPNDLAGIVANGQMLGNRIVSDKPALLGLLDGIAQPNTSRYNDMRQWPRLLSEEEAAFIAENNEKVRAMALQRACDERPDDCRGPAAFAVEAEIDAKSRLIASESARDGQTALDVLQTLATGLGRFPGPKQVLLFSEGYDTLQFTERVTQIAGVASRNRVQISTLDARGLSNDPRFSDFLNAAPVVGTGDLAVLGHDTNADVLTTLALETGGDRVRNRNVLRPALDQIERASGTYYVLGYAPEQAFDGSYRSIEVKVARPDVTVVARRGYLAARANATARDEPADAAGGAAAPPPTAPVAGPPPVSAPPPAGTTVPPVTGKPTTAATGAGAATPPAVPPGETPPAGVPLRLRPGRSDEAALGARITGRDPSTPDLAARIAREGWDLYAAGKVEEARDKLAIASASGGGPWVDYALGLAEFTLGHLDAAIAAWTRVRAVVADYEPLYFDLADAYLQAGRSTDALATLREAARRWPQDAEAHNAVGVVLMRRGATDDAIASFQRAAAAAPDDGLGFFNLGRAYHARYARRLASAGTSTGGRALSDRDRQNAIEAYGKAIALGGAFAEEARAYLSALEWR